MGDFSRSALAALLFSSAIALVPGPASAAWIAGETGPVERRGAKIEWTRIDVPEGEGAVRLARALRKELDEAARRADFGGEPRVRASARLVELSWERDADVLRVRCTILGRLDGGP